ncbi:MAG TPA: putative toxin-antitoxin system toxin component, PIN family [Bacillota bacterium]|nr:putative toxin-antitoxin system toxin component, PIN family [Bacillota bacterium]
MKVVLETNVLISGLLVPGGLPGRIIDLWTDGAIEVALSSELLQEYLSVLARPRFDSIASPSERRRIVEGLLSLTNTGVVVPRVRVEAVKEDPTDNAVLSCAIEAGADFVISGDQHLLRLKGHLGIPIVSPAAFLQRS